MSDYINNKSYIYLIKICDTNYRVIYKIGRSNNLDKRIHSYHYFEILNFIRSNDINNDEKQLIKIFNLKCKIDKGREFFTAKDDDFVLKIFVNYFNTKMNKINNMSNTTNISNVIINQNIVINKLDNVESNEIMNNIELVNNVENNKNSVNINNNIMNKTCPTCDKVFDFVSRLKAHLEITIHCKKTPEEIESFFSQFKKQTTYFKCNFCSSEFTKNHNLKRHVNNSKCKLEYDKIETEKKIQIEILQKQIDNLKIIQKQSKI